jgi:endonuclease YncB( thermonuclease family)
MTGGQFARLKAFHKRYARALPASVILALSLQAAPLAAAPIVTAGKAFRCTTVAVWDGDGPIWCAEGPKIRLAGLAAREHDESCNVYQPCPQASGLAARNRLVALLGGSKGKLRTGHIAVHGTTLLCRSEGTGKGTGRGAEPPPGAHSRMATT